jgi:hypothetical protein
MEDEAAQLKSSAELTKTVLVKRITYNEANDSALVNEFIFDTSIPVDSLLFSYLHHDLKLLLRC